MDGEVRKVGMVGVSKEEEEEEEMVGVSKGEEMDGEEIAPGIWVLLIIKVLGEIIYMVFNGLRNKEKGTNSIFSNLAKKITSTSMISSINKLSLSSLVLQSKGYKSLWN